MQLPHEWIAPLLAGLSVFVMALVGLRMLVAMWRDYERQYLDGAATTLDSMYIAMPAQNLLYLGVLSVLAVAGLMTLASGMPAVGIAFGLPAWFVPQVALWLLKRRRDRLFEFQLEDALMNVSNSLRAGFSLPQALELLHREMPDPMSQEMRLVCQELRLGVPIDEALENLHRRMPSQDVDLFVTAVCIVRDVGGNLTEIFENIARTIRERHRVEGKINALTAQGRMQAVVVCMLPFVVAAGMQAIAPELFEAMYTTLIGWSAIGLILLLMAVGAFFIWKIVQIDV